MIKIDKSVRIIKVDFPDKKIHISNDHTEGYLLIFRKTIWNLDHDFHFTIYLSDGRKIEVTIKSGYKLDFASTPKLIWFIYPFFDERYAAPALGHDNFYGGEVFPKWFNDEFLKVGMEMCGATEFDQLAFVNSVTLWGWITYLRHNKKTIAENQKHLILEIK